MADAGTGVAGAASHPDVELTVASKTTDGSDPDSPDMLREDRQALIRLCLYALDRTTSDGVAERIEQGLADVGVYALRPDGDRFDPAQHEAGAALPTGDAALEGLVAETETAGFRDRDVVVRVPVVTVYTPASR